MKNEHGIEGKYSHSGTMYGRDIILEDGTKRFQTCLPIFVPLVCTQCPLLDWGEQGDYGSLLSGPYCEANIWFPTRTGMCKRFNKELAKKFGEPER